MSGLAMGAETKGDTGGKGGNGPGVSASTTPENGAGDIVGTDTTTRTLANPDQTVRKVEETKPWELGVTWETHRMIRQDDLEGSADQKVFNVLSLYARYDLTEHDRISVRDFVQQEFIADQGESGMRTGDVDFSYTRTVPLPRQFVFSATGVLSAPTSFDSQKAGLITAPTLVLQLDKRLGKYVGVTARAVGSAFIAKYAEAEGGQANPHWHLTANLEADVTMPFLEQLSIGADIATGYTWYYEVQSGDPSVVANGVVNDPQFPNSQPVSQSYGGEIFARYLLPNVAGVKSDISLALADGDPSLGYNSVLHDGVSEVYLFFRQTAEVYGTISVRY
jgi:hypothetical protein